MQSESLLVVDDNDDDGSGGGGGGDDYVSREGSHLETAAIQAERHWLKWASN